MFDFWAPFRMIGGFLVFGLMLLVVFAVGSAVTSGIGWLAGVINPRPSAVTFTTTTTDPRFDWCYEAQDAGYGPYYEGDTEYDWYTDRDGDGMVCE